MTIDKKKVPKDVNQLAKYILDQTISKVDHKSETRSDNSSQKS